MDIRESQVVVKTKFLDESSPYDIEAIATTFGNKDKVGDVIEKGALDDYIKEFKEGNTEPLRMLKMHNRSDIIGEWKDIEIQDEKAIIRGNLLTDTQLGKDTKILVEKGLLTSVSIGFSSSEWTMDDDDYAYTFKKIALKETSLVDFPANENAVVLSIKNYDGKFDLNIIQKALRNVGLSHKEAKAFISKGKYALTAQRNVDKKLKQLQDFKL